MPLLGRAFNALWSDLLKGYEREFDAWHTIEHMPERIGVPGFLRGRRYMAEDHAMFILYEASHIDTFPRPVFSRASTIQPIGPKKYSQGW